MSVNSESKILVDSHCHLDFSEFDSDRVKVFLSALSQGVRGFVIPGVSVNTWSQLMNTVRSLQQVSNEYASVDPMESSNDKKSRPLFHYPSIKGALGLHPWWLDKEIDQFSKKRLMLSIEQMGASAVGECGLDGCISTSIETQRHCLSAHLEAAQELKLPIILHVRKAHNHMLDLLRSYRLPAGGVVHAYTGSVDLGRQYWRHNLRLGIGGVIVNRHAKKLRHAASLLPLESMVLETDSPSMPIPEYWLKEYRHSDTFLEKCKNRSVDFKGEDNVRTVNKAKGLVRNTPESLSMIAYVLADIRGETYEKVASTTTENSIELFNLSI